MSVPEELARSRPTRDPVENTARKREAFDGDLGLLTAESGKVTGCADVPCDCGNRSVEFRWEMSRVEGVDVAIELE